MALGAMNMTSQQVQNVKIGQSGFIIVVGTDYTASYTCSNGIWVAFTSLADTCTFDVLTPESAYWPSNSAAASSSGGGDIFTGSIAIPKGVTIYGRFTLFSLKAGSCIAYRSPT